MVTEKYKTKISGYLICQIIKNLISASGCYRVNQINLVLTNKNPHNHLKLHNYMVVINPPMGLFFKKPSLYSRFAFFTLIIFNSINKYQTIKMIARAIYKPFISIFFGRF